MKLILIPLLLFSIYISTTIATAQIEVGPYELTDDETAEYERSDIAEDQPGIPLQYLLTVQRNGAPVMGVRLDTWSANADGLYSGIASDGTAGEDYLRGWQTTDQSGQATFTAIYPGAYSGRTNHVHFRIREFAADGVTATYDNTTQLFFAADVTEQVMALDTYSKKSWDTVNSDDRLYVVENQVVLSGDIDTGFIATYTIELPLTESTSSSSNNGTPSGDMPSPNDSSSSGTPGRRCRNISRARR